MNFHIQVISNNLALIPAKVVLSTLRVYVYIFKQVGSLREIINSKMKIRKTTQNNLRKLYNDEFKLVDLFCIVLQQSVRYSVLVSYHSKRECGRVVKATDS